MDELADTNVTLGVTGSIAAVKVVELAHELQRRGATVRAVMTGAAQDIIHPWAVEYATDGAVVTELTGGVEHIELFGASGWSDVYVIAPATANTIGKIGAAIDDTPVTTCATTALGSDTPVVVAPAMHAPMYDHPGVLDAIDTLEEWGVTFVPPRHEEGKAKIADEDTISLVAARAVDDRPLTGRHVVVTAGATSEPIDPVRVLTNRSSGRTGRAIARACYVRGADVTLVHPDGPVPYATGETVSTAEEMADAVRTATADADAFVSAAAIGDFTVDTNPEKLSSDSTVTLELTPGPKVVDAVRDQHPTLPIVAFKLESATDDDARIDAARSLRDRIDAAFVVANDTDALGGDQTRVHLVDADTATAFHGTKTELGFRIADRLTTHLE